MAIVGAAILPGIPAQSIAQSMGADSMGVHSYQVMSSVLPTFNGSEGIVNTGALNIRSGPGPGYDVVTIAFQGTAVTLVGRHSENNWVKIRLNNGAEGWVNSTYINAGVPTATLPIIQDSQHPEPILPSPSTTVIATGALNLRSSPTLTDNIVTVLRRGESLVPLARNEDGSWLHVRSMANLEGWVNASYLHIGLQIMELPSLPQPSLRVNADEPPGLALVVTGALNVRFGPGTEFEIFTTILKGDAVTLLGRALYSNWVQVQLPDGTRGWVNSRYLSDHHSIDLLPVAWP